MTEEQSKERQKKDLFNLLAFFGFTLLLGLWHSSLFITVISFFFSRSETHNVFFQNSFFWSQNKPHLELAATNSPPPFLLLPLPILVFLLLAAAPTLSLLLLLLHWQVLVRVIIDKLVHVTSFLTLRDKKGSMLSRMHSLSFRVC